MTKGDTAQVEKKPLSWMAMTLTITNIGLALLVASALFWFGSIGSALAYLGGDRLIVDAGSKSFGTLERGQVAAVIFQFTNMSKRPITVLGASSSCTCASVEDLPGTIAPAGGRQVKVVIRTNKTGHVSEKLRVYVDCPGQSAIDIVVFGYVVDTDHPASASREISRGE
jgi:hypothetical protein